MVRGTLGGDEVRSRHPPAPTALSPSLATGADRAARRLALREHGTLLEAARPVLHGGALSQARARRAPGGPPQSAGRAVPRVRIVARDRCRRCFRAGGPAYQ